MKKNIWKKNEKPNFMKGKYWKYIVRSLGALVVFSTIYTLILPAITMEQKMICGLDEHTHNESCMDLEALEQPCYICGLEEHTHGDGCYLVEKAAEEEGYFCGIGAHTHGEGCWNEIGELTCNITEHSHDALCQVNGLDLNADLETARQWEADVRNITLTGDAPKDLIAVAETQLGYQESTKNVACVDGKLQGYTRYGEKYGDPYGNWSAMFVSFCIEYADIKDFPIGTDCVQLVESLRTQQYFGEAASYVPEMGDLIFLDMDLDSQIDHMGIIKSIQSEAGEMTVLAGNAEVGCVREESYHMTDQEVKGYGKIPRLEATILEETVVLEETTKQLLELNEDAVVVASVDAIDTEEFLENTETIAESRKGNNWESLKNSGWFQEYENAEEQSTVIEQNTLGDLSSLFMENGIATLADGDEAPTSGQQIKSVGGTNASADGAVVVSKTIAGTKQENVFDITLNIMTSDVVTEIYKEPDMAVAIVMDISNTMTENFGTSTRYLAAMNAAESFLDKFAGNNLGVSQVGFVAFNTDAHEIFPMQTCTSSNLDTIKNAMRQNTGNIITQDNYDKSHSRFTNVEAGLKRAWDMLDSAKNEHKYIIFLSDGFPTTYIENGYKGYDTYDETGKVFMDEVLNRPCKYGTSYSDKAAVKAREMAVKVKGAGIKIFSIGVDIGGQTIQEYITRSENMSDASVVERKKDLQNYEIGSTTSNTAYANWLQGTIDSGIGSGSGYYFSSEDTAGLNKAFDTIFAKIRELNAESSHLDWVATDPMPGMGVSGANTIEFIGFFTREGKLVSDNLTGTSGNGWEYENTASFDKDTQSISWDIKKSGYIGIQFDNTTVYECELRYRVRLENENDEFVERDAYKTNDITTLSYRVIEQNNTTVTVSEARKIEFPIPAVEGYLSELEFKKVDLNGEPLAGAEFTLKHDETNCGYCRGDGSSCVTLADDIATSDKDGNVKFVNIPSGHVYNLIETKVPDGYRDMGNTYQVTVAYDKLAVTAKDYNGIPFDWNKIIENGGSYTLPKTGGSGMAVYVVTGLLISGVVGMNLIVRSGRKKKGSV